MITLIQQGSVCDLESSEPGCQEDGRLRHRAYIKPTLEQCILLLLCYQRVKLSLPFIFGGLSTFITKLYSRIRSRHEPEGVTLPGHFMCIH